MPFRAAVHAFADALTSAATAYAHTGARPLDEVERIEVIRGPGVTGHNLLDADHLEFDRIDAFVGSRVPRRATARLTWTF
jgi:hypothetical protein